MSSQAAHDLRRAGRPLPEGLVDPDPSRVDPSASDRPLICAVHRQAVTAGQDGYVDPGTGAFVFTAAYHWDKGACCDLGCRHCPWVDADRRLMSAPTR